MSKKEWKIDNWKFKPEELFDLEGKKAIITGGASGMGRAIALGFDSFGANVVLADINEEDMEEVASELKNEALVIRTDVRELEDVKNLKKKALEKFGRIDISVNIPGTNIRKRALDLTYDEWNEVIELNLTSMFRCAKEIGEVMFVDQKEGNMINMASMFSLLAQEKQTAYSASKGGVMQMTKVLAAEWAPYVRVNALAPLYMKTPHVKEIMKDKEWVEKIKRQNVFKRFGEPEEIVGPALFLASNASSLITGKLLSLDAGWVWFGGPI